MASEAEMNDLIAEDCVVCGRLAQSRHHEPPKGMGGTKRHLSRLSLCGVGNEDATTCHGARHHSDLKFERRNGVWFFVPKPRYARVLNSIGVKTSVGKLNLCRGQTLVSIDCYDEEGIYSHTLHYETEGTSGT